MKKKLLFLSNHLAFFASHRLNIFFESKKRKYDFLLVTGKQSSKHMENIALKKIKSYDLKFKVLDLKSYKFDLFNDLIILSFLIYIVNNTLSFKVFYLFELIHFQTIAFPLYKTIMVYLKS